MDQIDTGHANKITVIEGRQGRQGEIERRKNKGTGGRICHTKITKEETESTNRSGNLSGKGLTGRERRGLYALERESMVHIYQILSSLFEPFSLSQ